MSLNKSQEWWSGLSLEDKFYKTIECNHLLKEDIVDNHPNNLTDYQIFVIWNHLNDKDIKVFKEGLRNQCQRTGSY